MLFIHLNKMINFLNEIFFGKQMGDKINKATR